MTPIEAAIANLQALLSKFDMHKVLYATLQILLMTWTASVHAQTPSPQTHWVTTAQSHVASSDHPIPMATPVDPQRVVGNHTCVKCHAAEIQVWKSTPHASTFELLHRKPEAKLIASKLGLRSIKHSGRCVACHYTQQSTANAPQSARDPHVIAGVSCESCHGAAKDWLEMHHHYGGESITRLTESPQHRAERITQSIAAGMRNPANVYLVAQSCLRCHTTADEELVNVGGHSAGSLDFEFVSWSQGTIRHSFVRSDGKSNAVATPQRLRVMFVAGMIAELESSLRGTAVATTKAKFGLTVAQRANRAAKRLHSVAAKVDDPILEQILGVVSGVKLKLNNKAELNAAADKIAMLGIKFAADNNGSELAALDAYLPKNRK